MANHQIPPSSPLNLIVIGSGHYATGHTDLSGKVSTDKDLGVLLPSAFHLRAKGWVNKIALCGRNGSKLRTIKSNIYSLNTDSEIDLSFDIYPNSEVVDPKAYIYALDNMPKPCAALIAVPDHMHVEVILACAERNIPFLVVKPAVTCLDDFYKVKAKIPNNLLGMVDYHKVYDEANLLLMEDMNIGSYGKIHHVSSLMSQRRDMMEIYFRWLKENPNLNINHYLGSHYIHMTGFITDATPLDVRSTQQYGFIRSHYCVDVADSIQTQVRWKTKDNNTFISYHIAAWADPSQTESMTYQQMHLLTENGHVFSDQRFRGTRKVLSGHGIEAPNPYFFNLSRSLLGGWNLETKYGYQSIFAFIQLAQSEPSRYMNLKLPTFNDSEYVTAILEAADLSLSNDSEVISISRSNGRLHLRNK